MSCFPSVEFRPVRTCAALLVLVGLPWASTLRAPAQEVMTHEELMRRARGLSVVQTNLTITPEIRSMPPDQPPISTPQAVSLPVPSAPKTTVINSNAQNSRSFTGFSEVSSDTAAFPKPEVSIIPQPPQVAVAARAQKTKAVFTEVPADFYAEPVPPASKAAPGVTNAMSALDNTHQLAIGDRLSFRIMEDEDEPKALVVTDSGELEVPYLGRFSAAGKTCRELAFALKNELEKEYYFRATVVVAVDAMTRSRGKVYLVGPVRMPGPLEIPSDEVLTLSKAILRAGGFTDFADKKNVKVTRRNPGGNGADQNYTVNVAEVLEQGRTESDLALRPGDLIYVQERMIRF